MPSSILRFPNLAAPYNLFTDAADVGLCAVLMQPEALFSDKEGTVVVVMWTMKTYRYLIYGYDRTIYADHKPLSSVHHNFSGPST